MSSSTPTSEFRISALPRYELFTQTDPVTGERIYTTPGGNCHSVTTILSNSKDRTSLDLWRESVGEDRANAILAAACYRGTLIHGWTEDLLLNGNEPPFSFVGTPYWNSIRSFLSRVRKPVLTEGAVWHSLGYAGTLDCLAYLDDDTDQPTLLDWKTADRKPLKPLKLYDYRLQVAAYAAAANEVYAKQGLKIRRALVVVAFPSQEPQIELIDDEALPQLLLHFQARLERFTYSRG
jgi:genome maintenance exonuclease 1